MYLILITPKTTQTTMMYFLLPDIFYDFAKDSKVDLLLQSPGGDPNAAEQLVNIMLSKTEDTIAMVGQIGLLLTIVYPSMLLIVAALRKKGDIPIQAKAQDPKRS